MIINLPKGDSPVFVRLANAVRTSIRKGHLKSGEYLPSTRNIAKSIGHHRHTVMSALDELVAEGWIISVPKRGYRIAAEPPSKFFRPSKLEIKEPRKRIKKIRVVRETRHCAPVAPTGSNFRYSFQSGMPDLRLFPKDDFRHSLGEGLKRRKNTVLDYTDPAGHPPLIEELSVYLRRIRGIKDRKIVITHGSQEGIFIVGQLLLSPGDCVGVEELGYTPAWEALRAPGSKLVPVKIDSDGILPESFEHAIKNHKIRLLYTTPLHQYPTTVTMPISRRLALYKIAAKYGVPILEDDYDHEFHYRSQPLPPLASSDPAELIIYVSTFSKVLFPSARIGFLAIPESLFGAFSTYRRIMTRQNDTIIQDGVARWMNSGAFEKHLRKMRRAYNARRDVMISGIEKMVHQGLDVSAKVPDGGMAVWINTGIDSNVVARLAHQAGVYVTSENQFQLKKALGQHLRLGFANQTEKEISDGMGLLSGAIGKAKKLSGPNGSSIH